LEADRLPELLRAGLVAHLLTLLVPVPVAVLAADVRLVDLNHAVQGEGIAAHGRAPAVTHVPTGMVVGATVIAADHAVNMKRENALLRGQHQVADLEPEGERHLGVLKDRPSGDTEAVAVPLPAVVVLADPMERPGLQCVHLRRSPATWTTHATRPSPRRQ